MVETEGGKPIIRLVLSGGSGRQNIYITDGEIKKFGGYSFGFNTNVENEGIVFSADDDGLVMISSDSVSYMNNNNRCNFYDHIKMKLRIKDA